MSDQVEYDRTTTFLGRNGMMKSRGVDVLECMDGETLVLTPLTSKGALGRCEIWIPKSAIPELVNMLLKVGAK